MEKENNTRKLISLLKQEMGYDSERKSCRDCNSYEAPAMASTCYLNKALSIPVSPSGICAHWAPNEVISPDEIEKLTANEKKEQIGPDITPEDGMLKS